MLDKVVSRTARALHACDFTVLRFNFRGVGKSDGAFEGGPGERDDLRAAIEYLAGDHDEILVGGFSFGAWVALDVGARDARVTRLLGSDSRGEATLVAGLYACCKAIVCPLDPNTHGATHRLHDEPCK